MSALIATVHWLPFTESQPLQLLNVDPDAAAAVSVTELPSLNWAEQVAPQLIPDGELVTVPEPLPALEAVKVRWTGGENVKLAPTDRFAFIATVHWLPFTESQPALPIKLPNDNPPAGAAVSVTEVPSLNWAEQVKPQLIPDGELVTVPEPAPALETVSVRWTAAPTVKWRAAGVGSARPKKVARTLNVWEAAV